ncbi:hypothetical protein QN379_22800 [Glaciimonas sp. Gout2]|uniref:hypothetical protein n=1 Tax=unclassified Glaciimonas TaxID=2644401 RepID=UPI002B229CC9|nr:MULTISPECIES: hypothetical protein [unclassified Glaciimonas]MEB0010604.1 hypothetical protein [Glaciimonas sp. Cout2]MEB0084843.1 hypothetical protein [Glaciimonas sp. Gout2]
MDAQPRIPGLNPLEIEKNYAAFDGNTSGVSWGAIFAGAATAAALSLILIILGGGLGLSAVSPWSTNNIPMGKATIIWLAFTQLAAAGIGGYMAGRLRVKWVSVHTTEVYFRDTAHGLLSWAVATLLTAFFLTGAVRAVSSGAIELGGTAATAMGATGGAGSNSISYFSDMLLRSSQATSPADNGNVNAGSNSNTNALNDTSNSGTVAVPGTNAVRQNDNPALRAEVLRIFANDLRSGPLSSDDKQYLSQQVAQVTGLSRAEADRRVDDVYARLSKVKSDTEVAAKDTADKARKIAAQSALWIFVALLVGAFFASITATLGGKQRDRVL